MLLQVCTVFAQLTVSGKWQGPHVFVVRLRDNNSQLTPGVKILDNGPKMGLNGVDNGQIWFDHVKVPRDALLDRYASVSAEGEYSSSIKSVAQRFGMTVGGLTTGTYLAAVCMYTVVASCQNERQCGVTYLSFLAQTFYYTVTSLHCTLILLMLVSV